MAVMVVLVATNIENELLSTVVSVVIGVLSYFLVNFLMKNQIMMETLEKVCKKLV